MADYIHYAPMANVEGDSQPLFYSTDCDTLEEALKAFEIWDEGYHFKMTKCWIDVFRNRDKIQTINLKRTWVPDTIEVPGEAAIPYTADFGLTLREIVARRVPQAVSDVPGGVVGCPSDYSFLSSEYDLEKRAENGGNCCSTHNCDLCWSQKFKG